MKIAFTHLIECIEENPSIEEVSSRLFQLGHEHEIESGIFNIEFTPNRGDCLSVNGLLRDLAVFYNINNDKGIYKGKIDELIIEFDNKAENICPEISFLKIEINNIPKIYKGNLNNYFSDMDVNRNNFFTDISNYLSYETGQPTHCYDAKKIDGKLVFHETEKLEKFDTLLDKEISLTNSNGVFSLNDEIINLAGVVGGKNTACSVNTNTVIVECAYFQPEAIIGKSVKYDIQSDASHKFERGVDPRCHQEVLRRFIKIVNENTSITSMSIASFSFIDAPLKKIPLDVERINRIIGINIDKKEYIESLLKLGFRLEDDLIVVPSYRSDIKSQNDLAEEIARVIGYDNIPRKDINIPKNNTPDNADMENMLRSHFVNHGFYEVINFPFSKIDSEIAIKVDNPLDSNREFLRTNLTNSLVNNLLYNERRQKDSIKLFEISDVYISNDGINKKRVLSVIASGRVGLNYKEFTKKINKQYLLKIFEKIASLDDLNIQVIPRDSLDSKIKSEIICIEIEIGSLSKNVLSNPSNQLLKFDKFIQYKPVSEYPASNRDISFLIKDSTKIEELVNIINEYSNQILKQVFIFDYYRNTETKQTKIGFRFIFQSNTKTLKVNEVDLVISDVIKRTIAIDSIEIPGI